MAHDVFVSYAGEDRVTAKRLVAELEQQQIRCWIAPRNVLAGQDYADANVKAIGDARVMVLVLSANANNSPHVIRELETAVSKGVAILPLRIDDVTPSGSMEFLLSGTHWLDALTPPLERHLPQLTHIVRSLLAGAGDAVPAEAEPAGDASTRTATGTEGPGKRDPPTRTPPFARMDALEELPAGVVFISHVEEDYNIAEQIAQALEAAGRGTSSVWSASASGRVRP